MSNKIEKLVRLQTLARVWGVKCRVTIQRKTDGEVRHGMQFEFNARTFSHIERDFRDDVMALAFGAPYSSDIAEDVRDWQEKEISASLARGNDVCEIAYSTAIVQFYLA